jgi:hypothetical protein
MIFTIKNTKNKKVVVTDASGTELRGIRKYNTLTREAEVLVPAGVGARLIMVGKRGGAVKLLTAKVKLKGSTIEVDGKVY